MKLAEYIWLDGAVPVRNLRSKAKVIQEPEGEVTLDHFPEWNFDGSSTYQSEGHASDLLLKPVNFCSDPLRGEGNWLVLCEVYNQDGTPHKSNSRAMLRKVLDAGGSELKPWIGFEQEYTLYQNGRPMGFPETGFPAPQGPYYCGVGSGQVFGRELVEAHAAACLEAGLALYGINAEVMPGQWEFQIGYRGMDDEKVDVLEMSDHLWIARWLLYRISESYGITPSFECKPVEGDWNGAGCHTNFSTQHTRAVGGIEAIRDAIEAMSTKHTEHIRLYGHGLERRLTGAHETCHIGEFKAGVSNRGCSIRIPLAVEKAGRGYFEDRRPGANCDPYLVSGRILQTITGLEQDHLDFKDWHLETILAGK